MTRVLLLGAATLALGACSLAPKYVQPAPPVPASWPVGDAYLAQSEAALPRVTLAALFRDPRVQALIDQALANNPDLRAAADDVAAARAAARAARHSDRRRPRPLLFHRGGGPHRARGAGRQSSRGLDQPCRRPRTAGN